MKMGDCSLRSVESMEATIRLILGAFNAVTSLTAFCGNLIVIVVILYHRRLRTRANYLICCLALTDLLVGLAIQPMVAMRLLYKPLWKSCLMADSVTFIGSVLCGASACILGVISCDRYIHIVKWPSYAQVMTRKKLFVMITVCWIIPTIGSIFSLFMSMRKVYYLLLTAMSSTIALMVCLFYKRIFVFIREKRRVCHVRPIYGKTDGTDQMQFQKQTKMAVSFAIIIGCYVICWLPLTIFSIYVAITDLSNVRVTPTRKLVAIRYFAVSFGMVNSSINPLIYFWRNESLRSETKKFILKKLL